MKSLRRDWYLQLLAYSLLSLGGLAGIWFFRLQYPILTTVSAVGAGAGLYHLVRILRYRNLRRHPLMDLLLHDRQQIVWVYGMVTQTSPYGFTVNRMGTLHLRLKNGMDWAVSIPPDRLTEVSEALNPLLPHATFGYSAEKDQWYTVDPHMLIRDDESKNG